MTGKLPLNPLAVLLTAGLLSTTVTAEFQGYIGLQGRWFPQQGAESQQQDQSLSAVVAPEWYHQFDSGHDSINIKLFYRQDNGDGKRSHGDIREFHWQHVGADWELTVGINHIFWGVTESQHLVDIINQTDLVEAPDGEEKLGQPMVHLALLRDWGVVDLFLLPGFRERTFAGDKGRLRSIPVTIDEPRYQSGAENNRLDSAARWSHYIGNWSLGLSSFQGTSREPLFEAISQDQANVLRPFYPVINQSGLDLQHVSGDWLWKLESIYRNHQGSVAAKDFFATTAGFEKTIVGIFGGSWDLGLLSEYSYDSRDQHSDAIYQNDLFTGARLVLNDLGSSELLIGVVQDMDQQDSRLFFAEASTRIGNATRISLEAYHFNSKDTAEPLYLFRRDSFIELAIEYHF